MTTAAAPLLEEGNRETEEEREAKLAGSIVVPNSTFNGLTIAT